MCKNIALNVNINGTYPYLYFCDNLEEDYGAVSGNETFPDFQSYEINTLMTIHSSLNIHQYDRCLSAQCFFYLILYSLQMYTKIT